MNNPELSVYFAESLITAYNAEMSDLRKQFFSVYNILKELIRKITSSDIQYFSNDFARLIFIIDKYNLDDELGHNLKSIKYFSSKFRRNKNLKCTANELNLLAKSIVLLIEAVYGIEESEFIIKIKELFCRAIPYEKREFQLEQVSFYNIVYLEGAIEIEGDFINQPYFICRTEDDVKVKLYLTKELHYLYKQIFDNATINAINFNILDIKNNIFTSDYKSIVVLEPDYLMDATEIAACFTTNDFAWQNYFLSTFLSKEYNPKLFSGNLINFFFDELVLDNDAIYDDTYNKAIKSKPLSLFALSIDSPESLKKELKLLPSHFANLKELIRNINTEKASIEPSFISPEYGLQGRLDLMQEYIEDEQRKDVLELKSGRPSNPDYATLIVGSKERASIGMWYNHLAQITCYNMLLDSAYKSRKGTSSILYSATLVQALRNAPNYLHTKLQIIRLRNLLIHILNRLSKRDFLMFDRLSPKNSTNLTGYSKDKLYKFYKVFSNIDDLERKYFVEYCSFIQREIFSDKFGSVDNRSNSGFSSLWRDSLDEKTDNYSVITHLELDTHESDFNNYHLVFNRSDEYSLTSSLRKGDIVILYPVNPEFESPVYGQIIKCIIKDINSLRIVLSLRNKLFPIDFFENDYDYWVIEPDQNESNNKKLFSNLFEFISSNKDKRNLLLGKKQPEFDEIDFSNIDYNLNDNQTEILKNAVSAKDYFLIQGPPGTGKTSYMLRYIVKYKIDHTNENILLMAYTNRAVDEICDVLFKLGEDYEFIRLGSRESSVFQDNLLCNMVEKEDIRDVFIKAKKVRIIVSTVSSAVNNYEIFLFKRFDTAIIDEAAQILEPHIVGIASTIPKFIMIGDEKQLPAIVTQNSEFTKVEDEELNSAEIFNLGSSLFERLLRICIKNQWSQGYGILTKQARMHFDIQQFPNKYFYDNKLELLFDKGWQVESWNPFENNVSNLNKLLSNSRLIFINSEQEHLSKINRSEAKICSAIIENYYNNISDEFDNDTIGVISPFRAQCTEIYNAIDIEICDKVSIDTVERFQGSERKIILYSFAVNHVALLDNISLIYKFNDTIIDRKLNVALTRAKEQIIIIGRENILIKNPIYKDLIDFIKINGSYYNYSDII